MGTFGGLLASPWGDTWWKPRFGRLKKCRLEIGWPTGQHHRCDYYQYVHVYLLYIYICVCIIIIIIIIIIYFIIIIIIIVIVIVIVVIIMSRPRSVKCMHKDHSARATHQSYLPLHSFMSWGSKIPCQPSPRSFRNSKGHNDPNFRNSKSPLISGKNKIFQWRVVIYKWINIVGWPQDCQPSKHQFVNSSMKMKTRDANPNSPVQGGFQERGYLQMNRPNFIQFIYMYIFIYIYSYYGLDSLSSYTHTLTYYLPY